MTNGTKIDSADLGEMLLVSKLSAESGFERVTVDPNDQVSILLELMEARTILEYLAEAGSKELECAIEAIRQPEEVG